MAPALAAYISTRLFASFFPLLLLVPLRSCRLSSVSPPLKTSRTRVLLFPIPPLPLLLSGCSLGDSLGHSPLLTGSFSFHHPPPPIANTNTRNLTQKTGKQNEVHLQVCGKVYGLKTSASFPSSSSPSLFFSALSSVLCLCRTPLRSVLSPQPDISALSTHVL